MSVDCLIIQMSFGLRAARWMSRITWPTYAATSIGLGVATYVTYNAKEQKKLKSLQVFIQDSNAYKQAMSILDKHTKAQETIGVPITYLPEIALKLSKKRQQVEDDDVVEKIPQIFMYFVGSNKCGQVIMSLKTMHDSSADTDNKFNKYELDKLELYLEDDDQFVTIFDT